MMKLRTQATIEYSTEYIENRDLTVIFEDTYVKGSLLRERIVGIYHGKPEDNDMKEFMFDGTEAVMQDEFLENLVGDSDDARQD